MMAAPATHHLSTSNTPIVLKETGKHAAQNTTVSVSAVPAKHPHSPEPSSINGILRQHARQRLYVRPLHWTGEHLRLLGCVFMSDPCAAMGNTGKETTVDEKLTRSVAETAGFLGPGILVHVKAALIQDMLAGYGFSTVFARDRLELRFAQRSVKAYLRTDGLFALPSNAPGSLAFLDLDAVAERRERSMITSTASRMNPLVAEIQRKKQAHIRPIDKLHDPFIAAVLIGLAQAQRLAGTPPDTCHAIPMSTESDSGPSIHTPQHSLSPKVYLLATTARSLHLYTACFPPTFLDRLDQPSQQSFAETVPLYHCPLPLDSPTKVSSIIDTIAKSMGRREPSQSGSAQPSTPT